MSDTTAAPCPACTGNDRCFCRCHYPVTVRLCPSKRLQHLSLDWEKWRTRIRLMRLNGCCECAQ